MLRECYYHDFVLILSYDRCDLYTILMLHFTAAVPSSIQNTPIEEIIIRVNGTHDLPNPNRGWVFPHGTLRDFGLDLYRGALFAANRAPDEMLWYLYKNLPKDYQNMMSKFSSLTTNDNRTKFSDQIGDDWCGTSPASKKSTRKSSTGSHIELFLQDDVKEEERHGFSIDSGTTLKTLFNDYADKRGISLRSLRFSYNGKTLFLSSIGNKTPDELSMRDQDVISVHDTSAVEDTRDDRQSPSNKTSKKSTKKKKNSSKRNKGKSVKKKQVKHEKPTLSLEQCKALHSKTLTKLHEEAEPLLKEIRMRLNALDLERQPPKQKKRKNRKKSNKQSNVNADLQILPSSGIGGKAGKPFFHIHVGEVSNLYKTTKPSQQQKGASTCSTPGSCTTLDLHGFTQEEALQKLDESLISWVDAAMRGSYPFVIPAKIVCGCGNQVISEVVQKWIHAHTQVRNSPKGQGC